MKKKEKKNSSVSLIADTSSLVIKCETHTCRITELILINPLLGELVFFFYCFAKSISPKENAVVLQEFEVTYYNVAVQHVTYYDTRIPPLSQK